MYGYAYWVYECHTCGTQYDYGYNEHFCNEMCYAASLTKEERLKFLAKQIEKEAKTKIRNLEQDQRVSEFMLTHSPNYEINDNEVVFYIYQHSKKRFLGRWQKDKMFMLGGGIESVNSMRALERYIFEEGVSSVVYDDKGTEVSWEDFFYYAVASEVHKEEQELDSVSKYLSDIKESFFGINQVYDRVWEP